MTPVSSLKECPIAVPTQWFKYCCNPATKTETVLPSLEQGEVESSTPVLASLTDESCGSVDPFWKAPIF
jgi:hypothetical protein